ncbi:MAG: M64 family metallopeptidase [Pirellulales bacterium]
MASSDFVEAAWTTVIDNGSPVNRVDIVFVGDGYTQANLAAGLYSSHLDQYLDYMFGSGGNLTDPFPRYRNFFNAHQIDVVSAESGADHPAQSVFRDTALDAAYDTAGINRLLTINDSKANVVVSQNLQGSGITADMRFATVNDATYGGSGGQWAVFAGANGSAGDLALHEMSHAFSATADEYSTQSGAFPYGEPSAVNVTRNASGTKWSQWLGFEDPRADYLSIGAFQGAADYATGIYRPSLDSKMRTLGRPFNAVVREKTILDIYRYVDPLDDWLANTETVDAGGLWVDTVDPNVVLVDWYVNGQLVAADHGEHFDLADFHFAAGTYTVRAHAYDGVVTHAEDGSLLDLVRVNLADLQQDIVWTVAFAGAETIPGDYNGDGTVDETDLAVWTQDFGSNVELAADGNGNRVVDAADYTVWRNAADLGAGVSSGGSHVPEPSELALALAALGGTLGVDARFRGTVCPRCGRV